jgi:hypothetical protein
MATMICSVCNKYGIYWKNLTGLVPHTYCPHCQSVNCQVPEEHYLEERENESMNEFLDET